MGAIVRGNSNKIHIPLGYTSAQHVCKTSEICDSWGCCHLAANCNLDYAMWGRSLQAFLAYEPHLPNFQPSNSVATPAKLHLQSMLNNLPTSALAIPEHIRVISGVLRASSGQTALDSIKCIPLTSERLDLKCKVTRADCKSMQTTKAQSENAKCWVSSYVLSAHPCITSTGPVIHRLLEVQAAFQDCTFRITQSS
jgi:hypothetical protein